MQAAFTIVGPGGESHDIAARWDEGVSLRQLLTASGAEHLLYSGTTAVWVDGSMAALDESVEASGLLPGSVIALSSAVAESPVDPASALHLAVTGGPGAGRMFALNVGRASIGRLPECEIQLADPAVSRTHAIVEVGIDGQVAVADAGSRSGTLVNGKPCTGPTPLGPGDQLAIGDSVLELRPGSHGDAVTGSRPGAPELRRPPRLEPPAAQRRLSWPLAPKPPQGRSLPLATALVPLGLGLVLYVFTKELLMLLFLVMTPVLAVTSFLGERRTGRRHYREQKAAYDEALATAQSALAGALAEEASRCRAVAPDPAGVLATVLGPRRRLWERRPFHPDFLDVRVGLAKLPSHVELVADDPFSRDGDVPHAPDLHLVPVTAPLVELGVIGVAGPERTVGPLAAWLVGQLAVHSGPADLQIVLLPGPQPHSQWDWARWLPHVGMAQPGTSPLVSGQDVKERAGALCELVESRLRAREGAHRAAGGEGAWPWVVAVLDPAHELRALPGMNAVLARGPEVRVVSICVADSDRLLPPECRAVVSALAAQPAYGTFLQAGQDAVTPVLVDGVGRDWCSAIGRRLAGLRDPEVVQEGARVPSAVRLVDLLGTGEPDAGALAGGWQRRSRSTSVPVGISSEGTFYLDIRSDGPHGLVAGTTGAGKSELLQSLVASLAVANRPDALNFLFVDYKGGSAFRDCARFPHTVGVVTDLDGHLTERALESLSAELKRREALLGRAETKDVEDYYKLGDPLGPLPRLLIVIDEFAGLVAELPEFVTGLVGIAQRGRSLGIHLVLATQRPSGVVSPEIRANTNLRIALRVTSPAESADIIDAPDAAWISPATPGRALARTGHSSLTLFQSARVGGSAPGTRSSGPSIAVAPFGWTRPELAAPEAPGTEDPTSTDLSRLADALVGAARAAHVPAQPKPWLPALPGVLTMRALDELVGGMPAGGGQWGPDPDGGHLPDGGRGPRPGPTPGVVVPVAIGLADLPASQAQVPHTYHLGTSRHLLVGGAPGSGRTTLLRSLAGALVGAHCPSELWLYAVDCGGGELRRLGDLPHCGAVVTRNEPDRVERLLARLRAEMDRRLRLLAEAGFSDVAEQRRGVPPEARLPYVVVLVDRWEAFTTSFDPMDADRFVETLLTLAREGASAGIRVVVTGDKSVLMGKLAGTVEDRLCLALADPSDYSLAGLDVRKIPPEMGPGRALRSKDQAELQLAVIGNDPSGASQTTGLGELATLWASRRPGGQWPAAWGARPFRIDPLPDEVGLGAVTEMLAARPKVPGAHWALVGVGGDELAPVGVDLAASQGFVVSGPRRSGRSTALLVMARSLLDNGCGLLAFCPRPSPLRDLAGTPGVGRVFTEDEPPVEDVLEAVNSAQGPHAVIVDDAAMLHGSQVAELLEAVAREGPQQGHIMVLSGTHEDLVRPMRGFVPELRQSRTGLLLCPESHLHGEVIGARLPRSATWAQPKGRGILVVDERQTVVQVPLPGRPSETSL